MSRIDKFIVEIVSLAKEICPEAEIWISNNSLEGEDSIVKITVPEVKFDEVDEAVGAKSYDILLQEGYDIVPIVLEDEKARQHQPSQW